MWVDRMHGAAFALVMNIAVAGLFAASFAVLAVFNSNHRAALWFSGSYAIGMLTPLSLLVLPFSHRPGLFGVASYVSLSAGLLTMTLGLAIFFRKPPPWKLTAAIFIIALVIGVAIWGGQRNTMPYELAYQAPFSLATAASGWVILGASRRRPLEVTLAVMFGILSVHFVIKSFLAVIFGSGATAQAYVSSNYALFSQAITGILLTATGLLVLLITVQSMITDAQTASETDPLSGLANRRGFEQRGGRALTRARRFGFPVSVALLDLDHFKRINDDHGHAAGDRVIQEFAELLRRAGPQSAILGRIGGEEFAVLFDRTTAEAAGLHAEAIRVGVAQIEDQDLPRVTVSIGVAEIAPTETLAEAIRRADTALYEAKRTGRNKVCVAGHESGRQNVIAFQSKGRP